MRKALFIISLFVFAMGFTTQAFALTVSPAKVEVRANPGQTAKGEIEIFNEQNDGKVFYTSFENFESKGDSGAPYFIGAKGGLATWFKTDGEVRVAPGERIKIPYSIEIPTSAKPGGYFAAIFFGTEKPKSGAGGEVSIGGKIGVLFLLRVNGDVPESAGLSNFKATEGRFFVNTPIALEYSFNNTGGDRVVPKGEVVIKNTFRMKSATLLANDKEGSVLPGSTRRFEVIWGDSSSKADKGFFEAAKAQWSDFHFGWYTAVMNVTWGESAQTAEVSYNFFVFPWQLLSIIVVCLAILKIGLNQYKKSIIREASSSRKN